LSVNIDSNVDQLPDTSIPETTKNVRQKCKHRKTTGNNNLDVCVEISGRYSG